MIFIVLGAVCVVALAVALTLVGRQVGRLRRGEVSMATEVGVRSFTQDKINRFYYSFEHLFRVLWRVALVYALLLVRKTVSFSRAILTRVEGRFSHLIDSVRGTQVIHKKGSVSFFLLALKDYKDRVAKQRPL